MAITTAVNIIEPSTCAQKNGRGRDARCVQGPKGAGALSSPLVPKTHLLGNVLGVEFHNEPRHGHLRQVHELWAAMIESVSDLEDNARWFQGDLQTAPGPRDCGTTCID